jgi:hypothetical protein
MPNGGTDCCASCGFYSSNHGVWDHPIHESGSNGVCKIRDVNIPEPFWTYCENYRTRNANPTGFIYAQGIFGEGGRGYIRIPWNGDNEPKTEINNGTCIICDESLENGVEVKDQDKIKRFCSNEHYMGWWATVWINRVIPPEDMSLNNPDIKFLYKYRECNQYSLANLAKRSLWAGAPPLLNDPFDCSIDIFDRIDPINLSIVLVLRALKQGLSESEIEKQQLEALAVQPDLQSSLSVAALRAKAVARKRGIVSLRVCSKRGVSNVERV